MPSKDPRIDAYIANSANFAKPILNHIRKLIHAACPDVTETMKWSFPHFEYKGVLCSIAAFKNHCALGFWKGELFLPKGKEDEAMGWFGRISSLSDLPADKVLLDYIKEAVRLNESGTKLPSRTKPKERKPLVIPAYFTTAVKRNKKALITFESFSYSHKKEYIQWVTEAKTEETRNKRLATTVEWLAEGKPRNWKYER